jgi:hypothetical protein
MEAPPNLNLAHLDRTREQVLPRSVPRAEMQERLLAQSPPPSGMQAPSRGVCLWLMGAGLTI